jgi:hypothetical protein
MIAYIPLTIGTVAVMTKIENKIASPMKSRRASF